MSVFFKVNIRDQSLTQRYTYSSGNFDDDLFTSCFSARKTWEKVESAIVENNLAMVCKFTCMLRCLVMSESLWPMDLALQAPLFMRFSRQEAIHSLLQESFLTQGLTPGLLHSR